MQEASVIIAAGALKTESLSVTVSNFIFNDSKQTDVQVPAP